MHTRDGMLVAGCSMLLLRQGFGGRVDAGGWWASVAVFMVSRVEADDAGGDHGRGQQAKNGKQSAHG